MFIFMFLLFCVTTDITVSSDAIFKLCKSDDDNCVLKSTQEAFQKILKPNEKYGAKSLKTVFVNLVEGHLPLLEFKLFNNTVTGHDMCQVKTAKFVNKMYDILHFEHICPHVYLTGMYEMNGFLVVPIEGTGEYFYDTNKIKILIDFNINMKERDGRKYFNVKDFKLQVETLEKPTMDFKNLFNGQKELGDAVLEFMHNNWKEVTNEIQVAPTIAVCREIVENANKYLNTISIDEFSSEKR